MVAGGFVLLFQLAETLDCIFLLSIALANVGEVHIGVHHFYVNRVHLNQKFRVQKLREEFSPNGQHGHGQEEKAKETPMNHKGNEADGGKGANRVLHCYEAKNPFHNLKIIVKNLQEFRFFHSYRYLRGVGREATVIGDG